MIQQGTFIHCSHLGHPQERTIDKMHGLYSVIYTQTLFTYHDLAVYASANNDFNLIFVAIMK